jgi:uncharacterized protein
LSSLTQTIHNFLATHNTLSLAMTGAEGQPHACALFYAAGLDLTLYFLSDPKTDHARFIEAGAQVAATIEANNQDWNSICGLQLHGFASPCREADEKKTARAIYAARYPFVAKAETLAAPLARACYYRITPSWIRLIDNTRGFGHKEEWRPE